MYLDNRRFTQNIKTCLISGELNSEAIDDIMKIIKHINFNRCKSSSFLADMRQDAFIVVWNNWKKFKPESNDAFSWFTMVIRNSFTASSKKTFLDYDHMNKRGIKSVSIENFIK